MDQIVYVFFNDVFIGTLKKNGAEFVFEYDDKFARSPTAFPLGYNFPLRKKIYRSPILFPLFQSLVSEGWLLKLQSQSEKIDERDFFSMLVANGGDLIGGIQIKKSLK